MPDAGYSDSPKTDPTLLSELVRQMTDQRFMLATMAGDIKSILARQDQADKARDDHEARLRQIEHVPNLVRPCDDHEARIRALERWRWSIPSVAAATGLAGLAIGIWQLVK